MRRAAVLLVALLAAASPLTAQTWVTPAKTPNTDVKCTGCPGTSADKLTVGYPAALTTFLGRYLDSDNVNDFQQHFRTARARNVVVAPSLKRLYLIIGSGVFAYDIDRFFQRLGANEQLADVSAVPVPWDFLHGDRLGPHEKFLLWDQYFYAENSPNGWITQVTDGQERLYYVDVDDRAYVYMAYTVFGWGIAHDEGKNDASQMTPVFQDTSGGTRTDDVQPNVVAAVKGTTGAYYAIISDATTPTLNIWDVTNRETPSRLPSVKKSMLRFVKTTDMTRIGLVTTDGKFEVYNTDDLVVGGAPLISTRGPNNSDVRGVATDGTNFYIASDYVGGLTISAYGASGAGYRKLGDYPTTRPTLSTLKLQYSDGYLVQSGITDGTYEVRLFKVSNFQVTEIPLGSYFQHYYVSNGVAGYTYPKFGTFYDSAVVKRPTKSYLVVTAYGLGDVYEVPAADSITVTSQGSVGHANPNRPAGAPAGPFYADPVGFTAAPSAAGAAPMNIQWDFGNPEADGIAADPNTATGITGTQTTHRYSGLTAISHLPSTRTVKATSLSDANISGAVSVTLGAPSLAIGIAGRTGVIAQASQLPSTPIVAGDAFVDASDGSVESHFATWTLGGNAAKALPSDSVSVGTCSASRTFRFDAHYGPYSGSAPNLTSISDLPLTMGDSTYSVRPFAAAVTSTPSADAITFASASRVTADTSVLTSAQSAALRYRWELLDANNAVLQTGPTGTGAIPSYVVPKSSFTSRGIRAHLVLTSPTPVGGSCAGLNMESAEAFTLPINGPDPLITGDCTNGGPPCSFRVTSASGVDQVADGWTYSWSVAPNNVLVTPFNGVAFTPTFTVVGRYTITATVANAIGSKSVQKIVDVSTVGTLCLSMSPGINVFIVYGNASGSCSQLGGSCNAAEAITFAASAFGYDFDCGTHTFAWEFGDGTRASGKIVAHSYAAAGSYTAKLTITNPAESVVTTAAVAVVSGRSCDSMVANSNVFPSFSGATSGCSSVTNLPCGVGETLNFAASSFGYNFACAAHTFQWNFGDGATATTSAQTTQHAYSKSGTYNVSLSISNGTQTVSMQVPVKVGTDKFVCPPIQPNISVFIIYSGAASQCAQTNSTECLTTEDVLFTAGAYLYDFTLCDHTFQWDFGDGSPLADGKTQTHRFPARGQYTVRLNVTVNGTTTTMTQIVKVREDPGITDCKFDFTVDPRVVGSVTLPNEYLFTVVPKNGATSSSYEWDFGDGTKVTGNSLTQTHVYSDSSVYTVTLTVPSTPCHVQHLTVKPRRRAAGR